MKKRNATIASAASLLFAFVVRAQVHELAPGEMKWAGHLPPGGSLQNYLGFLGPDEEKRWTYLDVDVTDSSLASIEIDG